MLPERLHSSRLLTHCSYSGHGGQVQAQDESRGLGWGEVLGEGNLGHTPPYGAGLWL